MNKFISTKNIILIIIINAVLNAIIYFLSIDKSISIITVCSLIFFFIDLIAFAVFVYNNKIEKICYDLYKWYYEKQDDRLLITIYEDEDDNKHTMIFGRNINLKNSFSNLFKNNEYLRNIACKSFYQDNKPK